MFLGRMVSPYIAFGIFSALIVGCGKVNLPYLDLGRLKEVLPSALTPAHPMAAFCKEAEAELSQFPPSTVQEYTGLRQVIAKLSPELEKAMPAAHSKALQDSVVSMRGQLRKRGKSREAAVLNQRFTKLIKARSSNPPAASALTDEIAAFVKETIALPEGNPCTNAFLSIFMDAFVATLDPFSRFEPANQEQQRLPETTLSMSPRRPLLAGPAIHEGNDFKDRSGVLYVTLKDWSDPDELESALRELEARHAENRLSGLVIDLRGAGGSDADVLEAIRKSGRGHWQQSPLVLFVDELTRGVANGWLAELKGQAGVRVVGTHPKTFGYGKRICATTQALDAGAQQRRVAVSCERLQVPQSIGPDRADGYQIVPDQVEPNLTPDRVVEIAHALFEEARQQRQPAQGGPTGPTWEQAPNPQSAPAQAFAAPASFDGGYDGDLVTGTAFEAAPAQSIADPQPAPIPAGLPADAPARTF